MNIQGGVRMTLKRPGLASPVAPRLGERVDDASETARRYFWWAADACCCLSAATCDGTVGLIRAVSGTPLIATLYEVGARTGFASRPSDLRHRRSLLHHLLHLRPLVQQLEAPPRARGSLKCLVWRGGGPWAAERVEGGQAWREKGVSLAKECELAHAFLWEYSYRGLELAQLLGQLGVYRICTWRHVRRLGSTHGAAG